MPSPRATAAAAAAAAVSAALLLPGVGRAEQPHLTGPGTVFTVLGHGWGHGIGMSQYGAEGAATRGLSANEILAFYYPGTTRTVVPAQSIRVLLTGADPAHLTVAAAPGLTVRDAASGRTLRLPAGPVAWRVVPAGGGEQVQSRTGSSWTTARFGTATTVGGPLVFGGAAVLTLESGGPAREYDGTLTAVRSGGALLTVNTLPLDAYVAGVVPRESPAGWLPAALQAQAVAARSYALAERADGGAGRPYDVCDSTACQVYGGVAVDSDGSMTGLEPASSTAAVAATAGEVLTYHGAPALTMFSSSDGGETVAAPGYPYLSAHADPYDAVADPVHDWTARLTAAELTAAFPGLGVLDDVAVLARDGHGAWGGRVLRVRLDGHRPDGSHTSVVVTGGQLAALHGWPQYPDGLRSDFFTLVDPGLLPAPAAAAAGPGRSVALFTRASSGAVLMRSAGTLGGWFPGVADLGGTAVGAPSAAPTAAGTLLAVRGRDDAVYARWHSGRGWSAWQRLGGRVTARPAVVAAADGSVVLAGRGTDGALWVRGWSAAGGWGAWTSLGGRLAAGDGPAGAVTASGQLVLVARGTGGALYARQRSGGRWAGWTLVGGRSAGDVAAAAGPAGTLQVVVRGTDGAAWVRVLAGGRWSAWRSLGGRLVSGAAAVRTADGSVELYVVGTGGGTYARTLRATWGAWTVVP